ncbi:MAG TPA: hypothetical protein VKD65_03775 [Candidatus Angelobacter sp.]|nr:hypothetical protein [Candidatus Angelobacter sp.]
MAARLLLLLALFFPAHLWPQRAKAVKPDPATITELVRRAVANYKSRESQLENYTYLAHVARTEFDRNGKPNGQITGVDEIMMLEGAPYRRTVSLNGRPLSPEQEKQQQMLLEGEASARRAGYNKHPVHNFFPAPIAQLPDEFRLRWRGWQFLDGHEVQVLEALPIDKQKPASSDQEYARHFKMRLWIDADEAQIVRVESEVIRSLTLDQDLPHFSPDFKFSGVHTWRFEYARGTTVAMEWTKVNDEAWLPKWTSWKTPKETVTALTPTKPAAPIHSPAQGTATYSDYKKFRVDTRVVPK